LPSSPPGWSPPGRSLVDRVVSDVSFVVISLVATAVRVVAARRRGPQARAWGLMALAQLREPSFPAEVADVLEDTGLDPGSLVLEITETSLVSDFEETIHTLHRLKELGVKLSIDDFGTGYSSLTYLRKLPVDVVKIDRSFVDGIATSPDEWGLAVAVFRLVRSISVDIVAEGVEGAAQLAHLRALGCDLAQGYYFAKPQAPEALQDMLATRETGRLVAAG
jgi:EAL domain-containing protein (putative c-di-GMP-specific phosphodiesterase class I)